MARGGEGREYSKLKLNQRVDQGGIPIRKSPDSKGAFGHVSVWRLF